MSTADPNKRRALWADAQKVFGEIHVELQNEGQDEVRDQLERRLQELKAEFEAGQQVMADLEAKQVNLRETLLRISGAIQVLEEELAPAPPPDSTELKHRDGTVEEAMEPEPAEEGN